MEGKQRESLLQASMNKCTLEDIDRTYEKLKELGTEELKNRLSALKEIQKSTEEINVAMTRETRTLFHDNSRNIFDLREKRSGGKYLSLPRIIPEIVDRVPGYKEILSNNEQLKIYPEEKKKSRGRTKKKRAKRFAENNRKMCLNCQIDTMIKKTRLPQLEDVNKKWLPQLEEAKTVGKVSRVGAEKEDTVLPVIKVSKYQLDG